MLFFATFAFVAFLKGKNQKCNTTHAFLNALGIFQCNIKLHVCSYRGGSATKLLILYVFTLFCKRETKSALAVCSIFCSEEDEVQRGPDLCLQRGRKRLACGVASAASLLGGNVTGVAAYKPSGEQPLRASLCLHLTDAPRRLSTHA